MNDGVGALQFSAAAYKSGQKPVVTSESLQKLVLDFALSRELGKGFDALTSETPILICAQSYSPGTEFTRVWYCSNGQDVALVTYTCEKGLEEAELPDCEKTVADLRFVR